MLENGITFLSQSQELKFHLHNWKKFVSLKELLLNYVYTEWHA